MTIDRILESSRPVSREPGTVLLETERLIIRRYFASDAAELARSANFAEVAANLSDKFPHPYTVEVAQRFIESSSTTSTSSYPGPCAVLLKPNTAENPSSEPLMIGGIGSTAQDDVHYRTWSLGYFLTPSVWGKGIATELMKHYTRWCFATWSRLNRIEADTYDFNVRSQKVLEKVGFVKEGIKRGVSEKGGILIDDVMYGLIRSDVDAS